MSDDTSGPVLWRVDARNVAYVTLNRPEVYNAYNGELIAALLAPMMRWRPRIRARW